METGSGAVVDVGVETGSWVGVGVLAVGSVCTGCSAGLQPAIITKLEIRIAGKARNFFIRTLIINLFVYS